MSASQPTCSVLICTYNRPALLAQALRALVSCAPPPDEVVVVNGGDAQADAVLAPYLGRTDIAVRLLRTRNKNLAASRNVGLAHCSREIIAMTDDDAEVFPDWLPAIRRAFAAHPEAGAVGGPVLGAGPPTLLSVLADQVTFGRPAEEKYVRTLPGVNVAYKRAVIAAVGLQDETLFRGEDVDYNWRVGLAGFKVFFDPAIRVYHHHRPTLRRFLQQHYMYGRAYFLVRHKWPDMYCVYPHQLRSLRDVLRAVNFVVAPFYLALEPALRVRPAAYGPAAYLVQLVNQFGWRLGMIRQRLAR